MTHVKDGKVNGCVGNTECDGVVEEVVTLADERTEGVTAFFLVKGCAGVTKVKLFDREEFLLCYVTFEREMEIC